MKILHLFLLFFSIAYFPKIIFAQDQDFSNANQFITIVNPIRISAYSSDPKRSLIAQYLEVQKRELVATWLFTDDAILDQEVVNGAKEMDSSQELGLFLEVSPKYASGAGVIYNKTDSWHRSNSLFLSGYIQEDRIKLIDKAFDDFKQAFGYFPKSVGAWWIDSYSLSYMQNKYKITANLACADQFETDGYQLWGQPWSIPFYPSRLHSGVPARDINSKLDLVTIQWAPRDPLSGYGKGPASLFSTQDYQKIEYFQKLINLYAKRHNNQFGQITVGLEGDFQPSSYGADSYYARQLEVVRAEEQKGSINVVTMKDFSNWYRGNFPSLSPIQIIESEDFLGKKVRSIWYNSPNYRVNIIYDYETKETRIRDFRAYFSNFQEPYYISPNRDLNLSINLPSQIDSAGYPPEEWKVFSEELEEEDSSNQMLLLKYKNTSQIRLSANKIEIFGGFKDIPKAFTDSPLINFKKGNKNISIEPKSEWNFPIEGLVFRSLTQEGTFFIKQRKIIALSIFVVILFCGITFFVVKRKKSRLFKIITVGIFGLLIFGTGFKWYLSNSRLYFVSQAELDVLNRLKLAPGKKVVVYDYVCLQCSWHTQFTPAIFANKRDYVKKISGKQLIYNSSIFNARTRQEAKQELDKLNADYIYLVRFEGYKEIAPFSPGDLNIEEVYSNANAQLWKVNKI